MGTHLSIIQWITTWQGLKGIQYSLHSYLLIFWVKVALAWLSLVPKNMKISSYIATAKKFHGENLPLAPPFEHSGKQSLQTAAQPV